MQLWSETDKLILKFIWTLRGSRKEKILLMWYYLDNYLDIICICNQVKIMSLEWVISVVMTGVFIRRGKFWYRLRCSHGSKMTIWRQKQRFKLCCLKSENACCYQKLEETRGSGGGMALPVSWFWILASRTFGE